MPKEKKAPPMSRAHPRRRVESILLRSAESVGRTIGTLHRRLDDAAKRLHNGNGNGQGHGRGHEDDEGRGARGNGARPAARTTVVAEPESGRESGARERALRSRVLPTDKSRDRLRPK